MIKIIEGILGINPNAKVVVQGGENIDKLDTCTIRYDQGTPEISKEDIKTKLNELQAEYDAQEYQRSRASEYPTWQDQLDDIFHNGIDGWKATIQVTKDKYPKE
tara:strand:- start:471 stop:782 length:312 start_codon:yes stop_codon:yes gene_type:complete